MKLTDALRTIIQLHKKLFTELFSKIGAKNGIAGLDENGKVPSEQLTELKTINGESLVGEGNIELSANIFKIVEELPEIGEENKIYLILDNEEVEDNVYKEYIYVNGSWELLGEFKAEVDLSGYVAKNDIQEFVSYIDVVRHNKDGLTLATNFKRIENGVYKSYSNTKTFNPVNADKAGVMTPDMFNKLEAVEDNSTSDKAISIEKLNEILV